MGWLQSRPRALQRLQQLLRQLARLRSIPKLVLGQVRAACCYRRHAQSQAGLVQLYI
jgi:hypothetical protein